ncbi:DUF4381 domain-containing protein [Legionella waltersii]|uniref:Transmembrane protein n=1 Tax=Legionella waltersii TaxID=66969 RepID=A0A0W1A535_9GAMM|nr:DUF4381 domain-containing protein [Legionella waltersii]KTD76360.1 hypothetical protein Lwal_2082 [Legionella waltersii]SNV13942.1 Uncharacterised protein [Legionella waltersii]
MANTEPLAQLKDIHLPDPVGWWPLAPGWYVLVVIALLFFFGLFVYLMKRHVNSLPKKQALRLLQNYKEQYAKDKNAQLASARVSELLKRVALVYYPRMDVASMHGDTWIQFLNKTAKGVDFKPVNTMLSETPFKQSETINVQPLIVRAEKWIKQRGVPCSN